MKNRITFDYVNAAFCGLLSVANAASAAQHLKERKYGRAAYRMVLSSLMAGYAAAAASQLEPVVLVTTTKKEI